MPKMIRSGNFNIIIIITNPLTTRVVEVQPMTLQPVFSICPYSPLPSGTRQIQCLYADVASAPLDGSSFGMPHRPATHTLTRWFWPDLMNGGNMTIRLQFASLYDRISLCS